MKKLTASLLLACFFTLTLLACQESADEPTATAIIDIPIAVDPTPTTEPAVATPTTAVTCPTPTADTSLYRSDDQGYCLLYPAGFTIEADFERPDEVLMLVGPRHQPGGQEFTQVILRVAFNGPAEGLNSEQYAEMWQRLYFPELALPTSTTTVGGHTAVVVSDIPGMASEQTALVVVDGLKYRISLLPQPEQIAELAESATEAWELVTNSIVFFEPADIPQYTHPDDVCPAETADTRLHINLREGFCMLYPATFESDERFASGFMGDSVLFDLPDFGPIHAALIMAWAGSAQGQSPHQFLEPRLESIDATTIQEATMGGAPALTYVDPRGPFPSRQAMIVANDQFYTIVNHPYDAQAYPDAVADVDLIWTTVTESLAFFDPWR